MQRQPMGKRSSQQASDILQMLQFALGSTQLNMLGTQAKEGALHKRR